MFNFLKLKDDYKYITDRNIWVTRPSGQSDEICGLIKKNGFVPYVESLMSKNIKKVEIPINCDGYIFTSVNGVESFIKNCESVDKVAYCVGDSTAKKAKEVGFKNIVISGGDVNHLAKDIKDSVDKSVYLVHISGSEISRSFIELIPEYNIERVVAYEMFHSTSISEETKYILDNKLFYGVVLFSPRTAKIFKDIVKGYDLSNVTIYCLSERILKEIEEIKSIKKVSIKPTLNDIVNLIKD